MPELPEVETVRRGLQPVMEGAMIERLWLGRADLRFPFAADFAGRIAGGRILALSRRAKYLLIELEDGQTVVCHLGMSGSFRVEADQGEGKAAEPGGFYHGHGKDTRHDHVVFHLAGENGAFRVIYNDPRRFGFMHLVSRAELALYPPFKDLGPEPTGNGLSGDYLAFRFLGKSQPLKTALLDQKIVAGLGNIYVCEALWRAGLSPLRAAGSLVLPQGEPQEELAELARNIRAVIFDAIAAGGSSLKDHIRADGTLGYFQHRFSVYDRQGQPCGRPGCGGTVERIVQAGRSTFYCRACQI